LTWKDWPGLTLSAIARPHAAATGTGGRRESRADSRQADVVDERSSRTFCQVLSSRAERV